MPAPGPKLQSESSSSVPAPSSLETLGGARSHRLTSPCRAGHRAPPQAAARPPAHPGPGRVGAPPAVGVPDACLGGNLPAVREVPSGRAGLDEDLSKQRPVDNEGSGLLSNRRKPGGALPGGRRPSRGPWAPRRCEVPRSDPSTALFPASSSFNTRAQTFGH